MQRNEGHQPPSPPKLLRSWEYSANTLRYIQHAHRLPRRGKQGRKPWGRGEPHFSQHTDLPGAWMYLLSPEPHTSTLFPGFFSLPDWGVGVPSPSHLAGHFSSNATRKAFMP